MKIYSLFLALFLVILSPSFARAVEPSTSNNQYKERRMEIKTEIKEKREEVKEKLSALRQEKIRSMFGKMIVRIEATIERLSKLSEKLEDRIAKIKENNPDFNTDSATKKVTEAKSILVTSKTDLLALKSKINTLVSADDSKIIFEGIKTDLEKMKNKLKEVHRLLIEAVKSVKTERKETK